MKDGVNINYPYISGMLNGVYTLNEKYINKILEFLFSFLYILILTFTLIIKVMCFNKNK